MKYAMLVDAHEGIYYYTPLVAKTLEEAKYEALQHIYMSRIRPFDGFRFEIITVTDNQTYNTDNFKDWIDQKDKEYWAKQQKIQDGIDKQQYERLKKKFGEDR